MPPGRGRQRAGGRPRGGTRASTSRPAPARQRAAPAAEPESPLGPLRLGAVPGTTPGKWIATWRSRNPRAALELVPLTVASQRAALLAGEVDAALVRLPIERADLHVIVLYEETPVVVMSTDASLSVADELSCDDLADEVLLVATDDVLGVTPLGMHAASAGTFDTAQMVEIIASGTGVGIVPQSLARLHHRKDVTYRPLVDAPVSPVALAWVADRTTREIDTFVGIVRGRSARSSRD